jgi:hypothetical protein
VWRQLRHTNILPFIGLNKDIFPEDPLPALVSPWMENGSLRDYIKSPKYNAASEVSLLVRRASESYQSREWLTYRSCPE